MYSSIAELDEIVFNPEQLLEDFVVSIPADAPTSLDLEAELRTCLPAGFASDVVEYYATVRKGEIPERLPERVRKGQEYNFQNAVAAQMLHHYLQKAGCYSKITKYMARDLKLMLPRHSVVLDPMTGNGLMVKALREAGLMSIGTDNNSWHNTQSFEPIDALDSLKRYGDRITHLLISWASPESDIDFRLLEEVRKYYEHIQIIVIGEINGCTGSEKFWEAAEVWDDLEGYETTENLFDRLYFIG